IWSTSIEYWCTRFACHLAEARSDARGDRAGFSVSDRASVDFDHWNNLGSSSREEAFVGNENIVSREICLRDFNVELAGNIKDDGSRDASQRSGRDRGCEDFAVLDDENVIGGTFGHVARIV